MGKLEDDDTLKMLVKLTSESKLLYKDLESTSKMRRARRLLYLAQLGLMTEKTLEGEHSPGGRMTMPALVPANEVKEANAQDERQKDEVLTGVKFGDEVTEVSPSSLSIDRPMKDSTSGNQEPQIQATESGKPQPDEVVSASVSPALETSQPAQLLNRNRPAFKSSLA